MTASDTEVDGGTGGRDPRRALPAVDRLLAHPAAAAWRERWGRAPVTAAIRDVLAEARAGEGPPADTADETAIETEILRRAAARLEGAAHPGLHRVLNGTGVVLHTNLGRAPLSAAAAEAVADLATGYVNLEFDVETGTRGDRYGHCADLLRRVTGSADAVIVNNNAAAVVLTVNEFARGRDVIVSRGELVEIGGSFRIPDMIERAGARLVEVGATNRTRVADYREALSERTGLLLKVHPANFRIEGFTESVSVAELSDLANGSGLPLAWDLGSAAPAGVLPPDLAGPAPDGPEAGAADLVMWSGDKVFGGPQAGIIHGRAEAVARLRRNPLLRAFRVDKLTLAAVEATLRAWLDPELARRELPAIRRLTEPAASVRARAEAARELLSAAARERVEIVSLEALAGAGSAPEQGIESAGWAVAGSAGRLDELCRANRPPLVGRVEAGRFLVDFRCLEGDDVAAAASAIERALKATGATDPADGPAAGSADNSADRPAANSAGDPA